MRHTGRTTRLFHAIVVMGLGAAAAGCGGSVDPKVPSDSGREAADDAEAISGDDAPALMFPEAASPVGNDAEAGVEASVDAAVDRWYPPPPPIA